MQHQVTEQISKANRLVVLKHPNSFDCTISRKIVSRVSGSSLGSMPTLGGLGVLSSEDESEVSWETIGRGKLLFSDSHVPSPHDDRSETINYGDIGYLALIEHLADDEYPDLIQPKKSDVIYIILLAGAAVAYEVTGVQADVSVPPYTRRYELQKRDELNYLDF